MLIGAEVRGGAGKSRAARVRIAAIAALVGGLLSGCSSWYDSTPKPPQMIQPTQATDGKEPVRGLAVDSQNRAYADGTRSDVTVVRPLRTETPQPPKVSQAPAAEPAPQPAPPPKVAQAPVAPQPTLAPAPVASAPAPAPVAAAPAPSSQAVGDGALPPRVETVPAGQAQNAPGVAPVVPVAPRPGAVAAAADLPADAPPPPPGSAPAPAKAAPAAKPAPAPTADAMQGLEAFRPETYSVSFLAASVPFGHGSSHLSAGDTALLKSVVAQFKKSGGAITVVGHASSRTGDMSALDHKIANFEVSVRRAQAVAQALVKMGVPARSIFVGAVSDNEPVYREVMPEGEAYNRRTEVFLNQ